MTIDLKKWMESVDNSKNVLELNICGTHDCVTKNIKASHFLCCQDKTIYEQLCLGIRALDIRVKSDGKCLTMVHGIMNAYNGAKKKSNIMDIGDVLSQCYQFLHENQSETIIFQFKNDMNKENEVCFNNLFYTYISGNEKYWYLENKAPIISDVRGKIILIRRCKMEKNENFTPFNTGIDFSNWVEQDTKETHPLELATSGIDGARFIVQDRFKFKPQPRWNDVILPFLDSCRLFNSTYIINYLSTAGGLKGPKQNAKFINTQFMNYNLNSKYYYGTVYVDFPTKELVEKIIQTNFQ